MTSPLESARSAHRLALEGIAAKEEELVARERRIHDELTAIENERRSLAADKETLLRAEAIYARHLGGTAPVAPLAEGEGAADTSGEDRPPRQTRARIGDKRYAMLAAIRERGPISVVRLAIQTKLNTSRIKEQLAADIPLYVEEVRENDSKRYVLTEAGEDLLRRFETYRRENGKPLPSLVPGDDGAEDKEIDPAHSRSGEAGVQGLHSATVEPVGEVEHDNMSL